MLRKKAVPRNRESKTRSGRDPEDRVVEGSDSKAKREKMFDKKLADSFPASDALSSLPDPSEDSFRHLSTLSISVGTRNGTSYCPNIRTV